MEPPKYAALVSNTYRCCMRLQHDHRLVVSGSRKEPDMYWRDAGAWGCKFREQDGKFFVVGSGPTMHLDGRELVPVTREEWQECNVGYVDTGPEKSEPEDDGVPF